MDTSKIIKGAVSSGRYTVTAPIVKEDYGLYLQIEGVELPSTYQVDFSNSENSGTSVTMIGNSDGVLIPSQFISTGKDVFAFLYHVGEDFGRTVYKFRIPNKCRPERTNEEPTPEEQSTIDQLIGAMNTAVAQTAQDKVDADASAQSASADAERAEDAKTDAQNFATQAEQSATDAQESASQASASAQASAQSAGASAQSASEASQSAQSASASATASAQSATASANSATSAQGYAQSASASAQSASGYASNAQTYSQTASAKAQDASQSASTASQKATEASQSATNASQSAQTAEQAKTDAQTAQGLAEQARDTAVQAKTDAESARDDAESARDEAVQAVESISGALDDKADVITDTASGAVASFSDGADDLPLKSLVVDINPVQDLSHGDPSPENICPISGWTSVGVEQSGENVGRIYAYSANGLSTPQSTPVVSNAYGTTISTTDSQADKIVVTQTRHDGPTYGSYLNGFFVVGIGNIINERRYYFRAKINVTSNPLNTERLLVFWNGNGNSTQLTIANGYVTGTFVASISDERRYIEIRCAGASFEMSEIMFMLAEDMSSPYEPYIGRSITIPLGQTVYGGKLYPLEGKALITMAMRVFDGTESGWQWYDGYKQASISLTESAKYNASELTYMCNVLTPIANQSRPTNIGNFASLISSGASAAFSAPSNTLDEFKAFAQSNPIQFCYELAEPIEIQLSPNQVNSLLGVNNIWADTGDTACEYRADTKAWVQRKIAEAISALS